MKFGYNRLQDGQKGRRPEGTRPQRARVDLSVSQRFQSVELHVEGAFCVRYDWGLDELHATAWQDDEVKAKTTVYRAEEDLGDFGIKGYADLAWAFRRACEAVLAGYDLEVEVSNWGRDKVSVNDEPALLYDLGELQDVGIIVATCLVEVQ